MTQLPIFDCRLLIGPRDTCRLDAENLPESQHNKAGGLAIGNRQSKIDNEKVPRQAARDFNSLKFVSGSERRVPELFSWLFYVAASRLNSPRFSWVLIRNLLQGVKYQGQFRISKFEAKFEIRISKSQIYLCSIFVVRMTPSTPIDRSDRINEVQ